MSIAEKIGVNLETTSTAKLIRHFHTTINKDGAISPEGSIAFYDEVEKELDKRLTELEGNMHPPRDLIKDLIEAVDSGDEEVCNALVTMMKAKLKDDEHG